MYWLKFAEIQRYKIIDLRLLRLQGENSFTITICIIINSTFENVHRSYQYKTDSDTRLNLPSYDFIPKIC